LTRTRPVEPLLVWALFVLVAVAVLVTYTRLPVRDLYAVSGTGFIAGAGRTLVFLNYPTALVALGALVILAPELGRRERIAAAVAAALCAVLFWPGVVRTSNLDAQWINAAPAVGVALAFVLSLGKPRPFGRAPDDAARAVCAVALVILALPWEAAELGFSFGGVPVLGQMFQTDELRHQPGVAGLHPAVHKGFHHGLGGTMLVVSALLLTRLLRPGRMHELAAGLLALMAAYGLGNIANDAWLEQAVKRGWTSHEIPSVLYPSANWGWGAIVVLAVVLWAAWFRRLPARNAAWLRPQARPSGTPA
jgi:hypothetical protein